MQHCMLGCLYFKYLHFQKVWGLLLFIVYYTYNLEVRNADIEALIHICVPYNANISNEECPQITLRNKVESNMIQLAHLVHIISWWLILFHCSESFGISMHSYCI